MGWELLVLESTLSLAAKCTLPKPRSRTQSRRPSTTTRQQPKRSAPRSWLRLLKLPMFLILLNSLSIIHDLPCRELVEPLWISPSTKTSLGYQRRNLPLSADLFLQSNLPQSLLDLLQNLLERALLNLSQKQWLPVKLLLGLKKLQQPLLPLTNFNPTRRQTSKTS